MLETYKKVMVNFPEAETGTSMEIKQESKCDGILLGKNCLHLNY